MLDLDRTREFLQSQHSPQNPHPKRGIHLPLSLDLLLRVEETRIIYGGRRGRGEVSQYLSLFDLQLQLQLELELDLKSKQAGQLAS